ncbi:MAG: hypothetical protein E7680_02380 [Ruminococcaceae bacterium]|nr:hypothetical protein [Oscillospiraceae bacterium]
MKMKNKIKELKNIEDCFFEIDKESKIAKIVLEFSRPEDIFDQNYVTKQPILSDDFLEWIGSAFKLVSSKYKIDLSIRFDDLGAYTGEELQDIFCKNIDLEFKSRFSENQKRNRVAYGLIGIGLLFFVGMLLIRNLWQSESIWRDIFIYVSDIATTVTFWEAMTILVVEQKEKREFLFDLASRFTSIHFEKKEKE